MMHRKAKVILAVTSLIFLLNGCSLFLHLDGSSKENRKAFKTGKPTGYETKRLMLVSKMRKDREKEIIDNRNKKWQRENALQISLRVKDNNVELAEGTTGEQLTSDNNASQYASLSEPVEIARAATQDSTGNASTNTKIAFASDGSTAGNTSSGKITANAATTSPIGIAGSSTGIWTEPETAMALVTFKDPPPAFLVKSPVTVAALWGNAGDNSVLVKSPITIAALWGDASSTDISVESPIIIAALWGNADNADVSVKSPVIIAALWGDADDDSAGATVKKSPTTVAALSDNTQSTESIKKHNNGSKIPRLKVVSGDGLPLSAKKMSGRLDEMGYKVEMIDVAPYEFKEPTVFYASGFKENAGKLATELNANGGVQPISWDSVYDIIVVSVNK